MKWLVSKLRLSILHTDTQTWKRTSERNLYSRSSCGTRSSRNLTACCRSCTVWVITTRRSDCGSSDHGTFDQAIGDRCHGVTVAWLTCCSQAAASDAAFSRTKRTDAPAYAKAACVPGVAVEEERLAAQLTWLTSWSWSSLSHFHGRCKFRRRRRRGIWRSRVKLSRICCLK